MGLSYVIYGFTAGLHLSRTGSEMELEEGRLLSECVVWVSPVCGVRVCCVCLMVVLGGVFTLMLSV